MPILFDLIVRLVFFFFVTFVTEMRRTWDVYEIWTIITFRPEEANALRCHLSDFLLRG